MSHAWCTVKHGYIALAHTQILTYSLLFLESTIIFNIYTDLCLINLHYPPMAFVKFQIV